MKMLFYDQVIFIYNKKLQFLSADIFNIISSLTLTNILGAPRNCKKGRKSS